MMSFYNRMVDNTISLIEEEIEDNGSNVEYVMWLRRDIEDLKYSRLLMREALAKKRGDLVKKLEAIITSIAVKRAEGSLASIGRVLGVTRERVRQIEYQALRKLSHPSSVRSLHSYIGEDPGTSWI